MDYYYYLCCQKANKRVQAIINIVKYLNFHAVFRIVLHYINKGITINWKPDRICVYEKVYEYENEQLFDDNCITDVLVLCIM